MSVPVFRRQVLAWYARHGRALPWRRTRDPYRILVSELMLQQTQVRRVVPIYEAFLRRFPTLEALAEAPLADALRAWKGLGYNRRAKFLWELARHPNHLVLYRKLSESDLATLRELPGIGHYTAAAMAAFAYNADVLVVDTNIRRVHQRYFGDATGETVRGTLPKGRSREWHNALMDFGALVCTKTPRCETCPLRRTCKAYKEQDFTFAVPKQPRFAGSNRYYRGRVLDALRTGPKMRASLLKLGPEASVDAALAGLRKDGLVAGTRRYALAR